MRPLPDGSSERADALRRRLLALVAAIEAEEISQRARIDAALPKHRASAVNLAHYLGLRKQDVRPLQRELAALGLSSLGRCEGHVRDTIRRVCAWLAGQRDEARARSTRLTPPPLRGCCSRTHRRCSGRPLRPPRLHHGDSPRRRGGHPGLGRWGDPRGSGRATHQRGARVTERVEADRIDLQGARHSARQDRSRGRRSARPEAASGGPSARGYGTPPAAQQGSPGTHRGADLNLARRRVRGAGRRFPCPRNGCPDSSHATCSG